MSIDNLGNSNLSGIQEATVSATWTAVTTADDNLAAIAWSPKLELFAAVPSDGGSVGIITSPDGEAWTSRTTPASDGWRDLVWAPGLDIFCAVGEYTSTARTMTSSDGITWTTATNVPENADYQSVAWSPKLSLFAAVTDDSVTDQVMISNDGVTWTGVTVPTPSVGGQAFWYSICWSEDLEQFTAVARSTGPSTEQVMTSSDGVTWTLEDAYTSGKDWRGVVWGGPIGSRRYVAVASNNSGTADIMTSTDGATWSNASITGVPSNDWQDVTWAESVGIFCAVASDGSGNQVITSLDGLAWTARTTPGSDSFYIAVAWGPKQNDFFAVIRDTTATAVTKSNSAYTDYNQTVVIGTQGISDITIAAKDLTIGQSGNTLTIGEYVNQITLGSPGVPINIAGTLTSPYVTLIAIRSDESTGDQFTDSSLGIYLTGAGGFGLSSIEDSHGGWDSVTGIYTIPVTGEYRIGWIGLRLANGRGNQIRKNATSPTTGTQLGEVTCNGGVIAFTSLTLGEISTLQSAPISFVAGDTVAPFRKSTTNVGDVFPGTYFYVTSFDNPRNFVGTGKANDTTNVTYVFP